MARMTKKITVKSFVVVCMFIQMLTVLPHHHHGADHLPCVNLLHCTGESAHSACGDAHESCPDHETDDHDAGLTAETHSHDTGKDDCSFEYKDVIRPARDENQLSVMLTADLTLWGIPSSSDAQTADRSRHDSRLSRLDDRRHVGAPPLHTQYIAQALPPRAPSFTA